MNSLLIAGMVACALASSCSRALVIDKSTIVATEREVICTKERPTGSHMAVTRCRNAAEREGDREYAHDASGQVGGKAPGRDR
jgi:hypothetical protein